MFLRESPVGMSIAHHAGTQIADGQWLTLRANNPVNSLKFKEYQGASTVRQPPRAMKRAGAIEPIVG